MIYSIVWHCGALDMQLEEMERAGFFLVERLVRSGFLSGIFRYFMHLSMREISLKQLLRRCAVPLDGYMADTADYTDGADMINNNMERRLLDSDEWISSILQYTLPSLSSFSRYGARDFDRLTVKPVGLGFEHRVYVRFICFVLGCPMISWYQILSI